MIGGEDKQGIMQRPLRRFHKELFHRKEKRGNFGGNLWRLWAIEMGQGVDPVIIQEEVGRFGRFLYFLPQVVERFGQDEIGPHLGAATDPIGIGRRGIFTVLVDVGRHPLSAQLLVETLGWIELVRLDIQRFQLVARARATIGKEQRRDCGVCRRVIIFPLKDATLPRRQPRMNAGNMRRRGRRKLACPLGNGAPVGNLLKDRMLPQPRLDMLPAKGIGQQHDHRVVLAQKGGGNASQPGWRRLIGQAGLDQIGQVGKTAATIVGTDKIVHSLCCHQCKALCCCNPGIFVIRPVPQRFGIKIGIIGPNQCMGFHIESNLIKKCQVAQGAIQVAIQHWFKINDLIASIVEGNGQCIGSNNAKPCYTIKFMSYDAIVCHG